MSQRLKVFSKHICLCRGLFVVHVFSPLWSNVSKVKSQKIALWNSSLNVFVFVCVFVPVILLVRSYFLNTLIICLKSLKDRSLKVFSKCFCLCHCHCNFVLVRSWFLITLIICLKGHECLGCLCVFQNQKVDDWLQNLIEEHQHSQEFCPKRQLRAETWPKCIVLVDIQALCTANPLPAAIGLVKLTTITHALTIWHCWHYDILTIWNCWQFGIADNLTLLTIWHCWHLTFGARFVSDPIDSVRETL